MKHGLIVIERPHQGHPEVWSVKSREDFINRVAASLERSDAQYIVFNSVVEVVEVWGDDRTEWPDSLRQGDGEENFYPCAYTVDTGGTGVCLGLDYTEFEFWRDQLADDLSCLDVLESAEEYSEYVPTGHNTPAMELVRKEAEWLGWLEEEEEEDV